MGLIETVITQVEVWNAYLRLGSPSDAERARVIRVLEDAGQSSLPCLTLAIRPHHAARSRFAAAVVLHRLNDPRGLSVLVQALQQSPLALQAYAKDLEAAFLAIGPPAATRALLEVWNGAPEWSDNERTLELIARVWAALKDPHVLDALTARASRYPQLFESTVPAFGEMAVLHLQRMAREPAPERRVLALRALRHIRTGRSFAAITPLLRDAEPSVRAEAADALSSAGGPIAAAREISAAMADGCSSDSAVYVLDAAQVGGLPEMLAGLVQRWLPRPRSLSGDTAPAVLAALRSPALRAADPDLLGRAVCDLLERNPEADIAIEAAGIAVDLAGVGGAGTERLYSALLPLLARPEPGVRACAAAALAAQGDQIGRELCALLERSRPPGKLVDKLHAILALGPTAGQAAADAVQQVSRWVARVSRETAGRFTGPGGPAAGPEPDARLAPNLRDLLRAATFHLAHAEAPELISETLELAISACNAVAEIGSPQAECCVAELTRDLSVVKYGVVTVQSGAAGQRTSERREVADALRLAAARALAAINPSRCYDHLITNLAAEKPEVVASTVQALGHLGDVRALLALQALSADRHGPHAQAARQAIAAIRKENPEMMTLLRGSSLAEQQPDTLLRPAAGKPDSPEGLLRPAEPTP